MNEDNVKGKANEIKGRIQRQAGEWTGNVKDQGEGLVDEAKGKVQNAWGNIKDKAKEVGHKAEKHDVETDRAARDKEDAA